MTNDYEKLKAVIQEANPERFVLRDPHTADSEYKYKYARCGDCFCTVQTTHTHYDDTIRLADVLVVLEEKLIKQYKSMSYVRATPLLEVVIHWNLKDDNLDHQSEECKQFLTNLLLPQSVADDN